MLTPGLLCPPQGYCAHPRAIVPTPGLLCPPQGYYAHPRAIVPTPGLLCSPQGPRAIVPTPGLLCPPQGYCAHPRAIMLTPGLLCSPQGYCAHPRAIMLTPGLLCPPLGYCACTVNCISSPRYPDSCCCSWSISLSNLCNWVSTPGCKIIRMAISILKSIFRRSKPSYNLKGWMGNRPLYWESPLLLTPASLPQGTAHRSCAGMLAIRKANLPRP